MRSALLTFLVLLPGLANAQIPVLSVSPTRLTFITSGSGQFPQSQQVRIRNIGSGSLVWRAAANVPWAKVNPYDGNAPATLSVTVDTTGMAVGDYHGRVTVTAVGDADDSPASVEVTLNLVAPSKSQGDPSAPAQPANPNQAAGQQGSPGSPQPPAKPGTQAQPPSNSAPVSPDAPPGFGQPGNPDDPGAGLMLVSPTLPPASRNLPYNQAIAVKGGTPPYAMRILQGRLPQGMMLANGGIAGISMQPGNYGFTLGISDSSRPPKSMTAQLLMRVIPVLQNTALIVMPPSFSMTAYGNQRPQSARLSIQSGGQPLEWHATTDADWLRLVPADGISPGFLQLELLVKDLPAGSYVATVTISMEGVPNSPARIPVQLLKR